MARFQRGDIFLYSGSNIISFMIKRITKSVFSHTGWINQHKDVDEALDANENGVEVSKFKYKLRRIAVLRLKLDAAKIAECVDFAEKQVGKKYDLKLFFGLLWRWIFGWRRKKDIGDWSNGYICSELVAMPLLMNAGVIFAPDVHPGNTVPGDIWNWARQNPDKVEVVYLGSKVRKALGSDCP
jgi:uncharacterized protein YycO